MMHAQTGTAPNTPVSYRTDSSPTRHRSQSLPYNQTNGYSPVPNPGSHDDTEHVTKPPRFAKYNIFNIPLFDGKLVH